jgi:HEAT repeat protein
MVYKSEQPPAGSADYPQAVTNFLKVLNDPDPPSRVAAVFSLGKLAVQPQRVVPALAWSVLRDPHPAVRRAAIEGLHCYGAETCRSAMGLAWGTIAPLFSAQGSQTRAGPGSS